MTTATLNVILLLIIIFVLVMHYNPEWFNNITKQLKIRTSCLRPEVSIVELLILLLTFLILVKLYF
jgi:hypothetical protein